MKTKTQKRSQAAKKAARVKKKQRQSFQSSPRRAPVPTVRDEMAKRESNAG